MTVSDNQQHRGFYSGAAFAIAAVLFVGFSRNYYLRAWFGLVIFGSGLAAVVLGLGIFTIVHSIKRQAPDADLTLFMELFVAFDGISVLAFAPAYGRLIANVTREHVELLVLGMMYASALSCLLVDAWRHRRVHPAFAIGSALVIASNELTYFAQTYMP